MTESRGRNWTAIFNAVFGEPESAVEARIWGEVLGSEYPAELTPYSFTTRSELGRISAELGAGPGRLLVDVGCGRGGPGLWLAATTGADYCGVDIAAPAVEQVLRRAARLGLADRARATVGSFQQVPLADGEADAVVSIDAFLFAPDKRAAGKELARVLRPGGRLVLTTWDFSRQPENRPPQVDDHRPLLAETGFRVLAYEETEDWRGRQEQINRRLLDAVGELAAESGEDPDQVRNGILEMDAALDAMLRRVLVVAERT